MSTIHRSCVPLGFKAVVSAGTARLSTVRSITVTMHGSARTATPSQARREAVEVLIPERRTAARQIDTNPASGAYDPDVCPGPGDRSNTSNMSTPRGHVRLPAELRRLIMSYQVSQAIAVAARLGIADLLTNGPRT